MSLRSIRARFACDRCGATFSVEMDPAYVPPVDWSLFDAAEDAARGSVRYEGPLHPDGFQGSSSVDGQSHLCGPCTAINDEKEEAS